MIFLGYSFVGSAQPPHFEREYITSTTFISMSSSALEVLEELHRCDPLAESVSLTGLELEQLDDATLAFLHANFTRVRQLNLSSNILTQLPSNFGDYVPTLVALDLRENPWRSIPELSETLATCSSLQSLSISLRNKTDEKVLRVMLPTLRILNGDPITQRSEENPRATASSPLQPLDLAFSPTSSSPSSGSFGSDSSLTLRWLDTPPSGAKRSAVCPVRSPQDKRELRLQFAATHKPTAKSSSPPQRGLSDKPTELPATISDEKTDWHKLLKKTTPSSSSGADTKAQTNKTKTKTNKPVGAIRDHPTTTTTTTTTTSTSSSGSTRNFIAELKAIVKSFHKRPATSKVTSSDDQLLLDQLDSKIDALALQLNDLEKGPRKSDSGSPDGHVVTAALAARWKLLETGTAYAAQKVHSLDKTLGTGLLRLTQTQTQVVEALLRHVHDAIYTQQKWQAASTSQQQVAEQQKQQMKLLLDVAETLEKDLEALQAKFQLEKSQREHAQATTRTLQGECDELRKKLSGASGTTGTSEVAVAVSEVPVSTGAAHGRIRKRVQAGPKTISISSLAQPASSPPTQQTQHQPNKTPTPGTASTSPGALERVAPRSRSPPKAPTAPVRCLTLKQLVDLIHCILVSKSKYDARIQAIGAPPETVEQHMYTYLNQRFGLQPMIVDAAAAIWKACQMYTRHDNDVAMFHAMLRNQVDEDFAGIKKKLQQAVRELLRAYFLAKHPMKAESTIQQMVDTRVHGGLIQEDEWTELLLYLYDPSDSSILMRLVQRKAESYRSEQQQQQPQHQKQKPAKPSVVASTLPFTVFEKLLCDYQLQGRLKLLEGFRELFAELDTERVGVIPRTKFRQLVATLSPRKRDSDVDAMLERVDPFEHDTITFSDAVRCLLQDIRQHSISRRSAKAKAPSHTEASASAAVKIKSGTRF